MPNSLKVMIKKLAHKGRISSVERDELLMKLDGHDLKIRADERAKVLDNYKEWLTEKGIHGSKEMKRIVDMYKEQLKENENDRTYNNRTTI